MPPAGEDEESDDPNERAENPEPADEDAEGDGDGTVDDAGPESGDPLEVTEDPEDQFSFATDDLENDSASRLEGDDPTDTSGVVESGGPDDGGFDARHDAGNERPDEPEDGPESPVRWFLRSDDTGAIFLREFLGSVLVVLVIGMLLFAISGVWPPMVAVKSGSMEPQMERGDLVFVMDENRFAPDVSVKESGIATYRSASGSGYEQFGDYGDVVIYRKNGNQGGTPIIHRARFWVTEGENWFDKANESFLEGEDCEAVRNCPAPHDGFITKGDNNRRYDQVSGISDPVKPGWIKGTAELRIPWLGHVRLELSELTIGSAEPATSGVAAG